MYNKEILSETSQNIKYVQGKIHELLFQISLFRLMLIESLAEFVMMNKYSKYIKAYSIEEIYYLKYIRYENKL